MGKHFLWDPVEDNIVKEIDDSGTTIADYTTEPYLYGDLISQHRGGQSSYYHYDGQGSTTSLTDVSGNVTDTYAYSAFGEITERTGTTVSPCQYVGQKGYYQDAATGDCNVRRRTLLTCGRWMVCDPIRRQFDYHPYSYVNSRPVLYIDPSGLSIVFQAERDPNAGASPCLPLVPPPSLNNSQLKTQVWFVTIRAQQGRRSDALGQFGKL